MRMSPIPSLRNRHVAKSVENDASAIRMQPSFRMTSPGSRYAYPARPHMGKKAPQRRKLMQHFKTKAKALKNSLPKIKDVNVIDKYSRLVFPLAFMLFNAAYWTYYSIPVEVECGKGQ